jgi:hypothetical protein
MCIQFFLEYQHCSHYHYLSEQHCSDSLLCVRNAPLIYRLRHTNAAPGPPPSQPSDPSVSYPLTTCEICLSTLGEQLDPEQVPVQYYPPSNNFDVRLRQDAAFGRFVRVEEDRSDAKSLSDIDTDDEDCDAGGGGGGATHEYYNPTTALEHQALLDTQLYNLPYWIAHQQAYGVGAYGQVQYWYTPWGVVAVIATQESWVGEGLMADGTSAAPLPPRKQRKSQSHGSSKMTNSHSRKQSKHSQSEQPRSKLPQPRHPQSKRAESKHSQSGRSESNPSESNPPESNASESGPSESSRSSDRSTPPTVASIKPLAPLPPRFMGSTAVSRALPLDTQTRLENLGGPACASSLPPAPQQDLPQAGRDSVLSRAPRRPRADRRSKRPRLDHLPDRQVTLEHYLVQTKRKSKGKVAKEKPEGGVKDGGDAISVLLGRIELETETETGTGMEVERPIEEVEA